MQTGSSHIVNTCSECCGFESTSQYSVKSQGRHHCCHWLVVANAKQMQQLFSTLDRWLVQCNVFHCSARHATYCRWGETQPVYLVLALKLAGKKPVTWHRWHTVAFNPPCPSATQSQPRNICMPPLQKGNSGKCAWPSELHAAP